MDSVTAVYYVREQGECKFLKYNKIAREIFNWALHKNIVLAHHIYWEKITVKLICKEKVSRRNINEHWMEIRI